MPFILTCYVNNYLDRVSMGYGKRQFMSEMHMNEAAFGMVTWSSSLAISRQRCRPICCCYASASRATLTRMHPYVTVKISFGPLPFMACRVARGQGVFHLT
jgi:hypothetical protein